MDFIERVKKNALRVDLGERRRPGELLRECVKVRLKGKRR